MSLSRVLSLSRVYVGNNRVNLIRLYQSRIIIANEKGNMIVHSNVIGNNSNSNSNSNTNTNIISSYNEKSSHQSNLTPKELLYASLASCTIMTIRTYYNNCKNGTTNISSLWSNGVLDEIEVQVKEDNTADKHVPTSINLYIKFKGILSIDQRKRLLHIANHCPVKQMISTTTTTHLIENENH